jgi:polyisoprenoid-binding protein YceI
MAQNTQLTVHPKSHFWIQGRATGLSFTCRVPQVDGRATLHLPDDSLAASADEAQTEVIVTVPVKAFDCGRDGMTRDLQETLNMEDHPQIRFELIHATVTSETDTSAQWRRVEVLGALTIAGTKRLTRLHAAGRALDENRFRVRGCHPIRMTYYNVEPPAKALGLVKVKNRVEVQFDLLAHTTGHPEPPSFDSVTIGDPPSCESE